MISAYFVVLIYALNASAVIHRVYIVTIVTILSNVAYVVMNRHEARVACEAIVAFQMNKSS